MYAVIILGTFLLLKIVNFRLHKALDMNPQLEEEEEDKRSGEGEGEDQEAENDGGEKEKRDEEEKIETDRKELGLDGKIVGSAEAKAMEAGAPPHSETQLSTEEKQIDIEESLKQHRDSASTLGHSSNQQSSQEDTAELLPLVTSPEDGKAVQPRVVSVDQEQMEGRAKEELLDQADSSPSTLKVEKGSSSEGDYQTPPLLSLAPGSSMEPGLKPINEEPQKSDEMGPSLSQPEGPGEKIPMCEM